MCKMIAIDLKWSWPMHSEIKHQTSWCLWSKAVLDKVSCLQATVTPEHTHTRTCNNRHYVSKVISNMCTLIMCDQKHASIIIHLTIIMQEKGKAKIRKDLTAVGVSSTVMRLRPMVASKDCLTITLMPFRAHIPSLSSQLYLAQRKTMEGTVEIGKVWKQVKFA